MPIYRVTQLARLDGNEQRNVWYIGNTDTVEDDVFHWINDVLRANWDSTIATVQAIEWTWYACSYQNASVAGSPVIPFPITVVNGDLAGGNFLPLQVAGLITFRAMTARPNRAAKYIGGLSETYLHGGLFMDQVTDAFGDFADALLADGVVNPERGIACAHYDPAAHRVTTANPATTRLITNIPSTQRRRKKGRGI